MTKKPGGAGRHATRGCLWAAGLAIALTGTACGPGSPDAGPANTPYGGGPDRPAEEIEWLSERSNQYYSRIGPVLGQPRKGRFVDDGRYVVILDILPPHLHLFRADGEWLWSGGLEGDGPGELRLGPSYALGTSGRQVMVPQRGRLTLWTVSGDSLALERTVRLPFGYVPQGLTDGCSGGWLLYGRDESGMAMPEDGWNTTEAPELPFLHRMRVEGDSVRLEPLWRDRPDLIGWQVGHDGATVDRAGAHVALHYRPNVRGAPGSFLEFDCDGTLLRSVDKRGLVSGDSFPVLAPRDRVLGTLGILALESGFLTATRRRFVPQQGHEVEESTVQTEIFHFAEGSFQGSILIPQDWMLFDLDPEGWVLAGQRVPVPRWVRLPLDSLFPDAR